MHDRRQEIAEAAWRVILRDGLSRMSVRAVAREMSATTGLISHHYANKDDLVATALDLVTQRTMDTASEAGTDASGLERLEEMVLAAMPMSEESRREWQVWLAFLGYSIGNTNLIARHQQRYKTLRSFMAVEIRYLQAQSIISPKRKPEAEADALIALVDGVGLGAAVDAERFTPERQRILVRRHLDELRHT